MAAKCLVTESRVEFGILTHFCYEIDGKENRIPVVTTRPDTVLGDTGIAVHPDNKWYS